MKVCCLSFVISLVNAVNSPKNGMVNDYDDGKAISTFDPGSRHLDKLSRDEDFCHSVWKRFRPPEEPANWDHLVNVKISLKELTMINC